MCANSNDSNNCSSWRALRLAHFPDLTLSVAAILLDTKPPGAIAAGGDMPRCDRRRSHCLQPELQ